MTLPITPRPAPDAAMAALEGMIVKGKADPAAARTLKCRTVARGRFSQLSYIRDLPPQHVIEAEPRGRPGESFGDTTAPNASEALLAALGSCLAVGIHANVVAQRTAVRSLELEVEADINTTAVWGAGDLSPKAIGFEAIRVSVRLDADAPHDRLASQVEHATLWSPVANTLHNPVHLDALLVSAGSEASPPKVAEPT